MNIFSSILGQDNRLHKLKIFFIGAFSGALAFPLTFVIMVPILPGLLFSYFVVKLSKYYGFFKGVKLWYLAGALSYLAAFVTLVFNGAASSEYVTFFSLGFTGLVGGLVLLLFAKKITGHVPEGSSFLLLPISFAIPSVIFLIVGGEAYTISDPMFGIPDPTVKYLLPVMMIWQGTALLAIDYLLRKKKQNLTPEEQLVEKMQSDIEKPEVNKDIKKMF